MVPQIFDCSQKQYQHQTLQEDEVWSMQGDLWHMQPVPEGKYFNANLLTQYKFTLTGAPMCVFTFRSISGQPRICTKCCIF
jgi:hypothetical protein